MKALLASFLLATSMTACAADTKLELSCYKPSPTRMTVHYKNADSIVYDEITKQWIVEYKDTLRFAGGVVYYKQELHESCSIIEKRDTQ